MYTLPSTVGKLCRAALYITTGSKKATKLLANRTQETDNETERSQHVLTQGEPSTRDTLKQQYAGGSD